MRCWAASASSSVAPRRSVSARSLRIFSMMRGSIMRSFPGLVLARI
jgi:hypothetical protein